MRNSFEVNRSAGQDGRICGRQTKNIQSDQNDWPLDLWTASTGGPSDRVIHFFIDIVLKGKLGAVSFSSKNAPVATLFSTTDSQYLSTNTIRRHKSGL